MIPSFLSALEAAGQGSGFRVLGFRTCNAGGPSKLELRFISFRLCSECGSLLWLVVYGTYM